MTNLFQAIANGNRGLNKTAELTSAAEKIESVIFSKIGEELDTAEKEIAVLKAELTTAAEADKEVLQAQLDDKTALLDKIYTAVEDSKVSHEGMDKLIADSYNLQMVDVSFLQIEDVADKDNEEAVAAYNAKVAENDAVIDKMIKSQQSKRSRAKGKAMTQDNYNTLMVGAISENLLRIASGKEKAAVGHSGNSKPIEYDEATLESYKTDKEKLSKEIRNIQSKKSIMKSKANFDDKSDAWIKLLDAEAMLKSLRGDAAATVTKVVIPDYVAPLVAAKKFIETEVEPLDLKSMKAADAKDIIARIVSMMAEVELPVDESNEEAPSNEDNAE